MDLSAAEIRVLGCLLEKQRTTPDYYPLSLNSLRLACNQSTNREPVVDYDDATIRDALHRLQRRGYARLAGASRAAKYRHLLSEALPMSGAEQAIVCVLMLRGPQTPGELKQRGERMHAFADLDEVHATLAALIERGLAAQLGRRPGQKEDRYAQLLGDDESKSETHLAAAAATANGLTTTAPLAPLAAGGHGELRERVARLEREVAELRRALADLGAGVETASSGASERAHYYQPAAGTEPIPAETAVAAGDVEPTVAETAVAAGDVEPTPAETAVVAAGDVEPNRDADDLERAAQDHTAAQTR